MAGLAGPGSGTLQPSSGEGGAWSVPLGAYVGAADPEGVAAFGTATGTKPTYASDYLPWQSGWAAMSNASSLAWLLGPWHSAGYTLVLGVPMIPEDASGATQGTLAAGASGAYDSYFATLAQTLVAGGQADAVLRLGWEFNGDWYPWSVANPSDAANYASYFANIVMTMRTVPGEGFKFVWNPTDSGSYGNAYTPDEAYPGDAYVDDVGADVYDQCWCSPQDPQTAWDSQLQGPWGLNWLQAFANQHDKPIALPEWGVTIRSDGHGLGDDPYFVSEMALWISQNDVAFTSYFEFDASDGSHDLVDGNFPNSLTAFRAAFDPPTTTSPPTTVPPTPPTVPPTTVPPTTVPPTTVAPTTVPSTVPMTTPPATTPPVTTPPTTTPPTTVPPTTVPPTTVAPTTVPTTPTTVPPVSPMTPTAMTFTIAPDPTSPAEILTWTVTPVPDGGDVSFSVDGWDGQLPVSTTSGTVALALLLLDGPHTADATYSGFGSFASSTMTSTFTGGLELTSLTVTPPIEVGSGSEFLLEATMTSGEVPIPGAPVSFFVHQTEICHGTTDTNGIVTCIVNEGGSDGFGLATGSVTATFGGDPNHTPAVSASPLSVPLAEDDASHIAHSGSDAPGVTVTSSTTWGTSSTTEGTSSATADTSGTTGDPSGTTERGSTSGGAPYPAGAAAPSGARSTVATATRSTGAGAGGSSASPGPQVAVSSAQPPEAEHATSASPRTHGSPRRAAGSGATGASVQPLALVVLALGLALVGVGMARRRRVTSAQQ